VEVEPGVKDTVNGVIHVGMKAVIMDANAVGMYAFLVSWLSVVGSEAGPSGMVENVFFPATV